MDKVTHYLHKSIIDYHYLDIFIIEEKNLFHYL